MNEIAEYTGIGQLPELRPSKEILEEAAERAQTLHEMVQRTHCSVKIGEREHLNIEAWICIARFYNCTVQAHDAMPIEVFGIEGAKAHATVLHVLTGKVIGGADAYCMRDEENWHEKPWFQLASMAQTRACSKALSLVFRWIAPLAGYATTPAEEMDEKTIAYQVKIPFGPNKGKTPKDLTTEQLCTEQATFQQLADDPTNKFRDNNRKLVGALKAELDTRHPIHASPLTASTAAEPFVFKGDAALFADYQQKLKEAKEAKVIRDLQKLGATDKRLSVDQMTAINDVAVELLAKKP